jgi:hypothetical protein
MVKCAGNRGWPVPCRLEAPVPDDVVLAELFAATQAAVDYLN